MYHIRRDAKLTWKLPHIKGNVAHFVQRGGKSYEAIISEENIELYFKIGCKMVGHMHISQI
jgi:hypothetical protein